MLSSLATLTMLNLTSLDSAPLVIIIKLIGLVELRRAL